jgi:NADH dehydrogenase subunit D (EC 1.6.5.3)
MATELPSDVNSSEVLVDQTSSKWLPPGLALQKVDERIMTLNVGPQHPGSGHMRLIVQN